LGRLGIGGEDIIKMNLIKSYLKLYVGWTEMAQIRVRRGSFVAR